MFTLVSNLTIARWDSRPIGFFGWICWDQDRRKLSCWRCNFSTSWTLKFVFLKCLRVGARKVEQGFCMILQTSQADVFFFMITRMVQCWMLIVFCCCWIFNDKKRINPNPRVELRFVFQLITAKSPNFKFKVFKSTKVICKTLCNVWCCLWFYTPEN